VPLDLFSSNVPPPPNPGTYKTLMSDPPWLERGSGQIKRGADRHYPLMKTDAICALPVSSWMADDAHAYVWVTNNFLPDGLRVLDAWGFRYVTKIDWFKTYEVLEKIADDDDLCVGLGQYFRGCTESCLFGVRGHVPYQMRDGKRMQGRTGFHAPRGEHSVKPETMRRMVERVSPGPYLEMFARRPVPGWSVWGNEITEASK